MNLKPDGKKLKKNYLLRKIKYLLLEIARQTKCRKNHNLDFALIKQGYTKNIKNFKKTYLFTDYYQLSKILTMIFR